MKLTTKVLGTLTCVLSLNALATDLQPIDWTLTSAQIKENTKSKLTEDTPKRLTFESELFGAEFHLEYIFDDQQKLKTVLYYQSFDAKAENCSTEYKRYKQLVEEQYGETEAEVFKTDNAKVAPADQHCAFAARGEYRASSEWKSSHQTSNLSLATWKGTPYIGLSMTPNK